MYSTVWHSRHNLNFRLRTKFRGKLKTFQKKNPNIKPFSLDSKNLASNWWGKAWNAHLKNYTFNTIRLEKGKLNFKCEALADFRITSKNIKAIVLGSNIKPYTVNITIKPITKTKWNKIQKLYEGRLDLFEKILDNHFPKEMANIFKNKPTGLLPAANEIEFNCTCPDRANLCKHTAVVLYALGAKIDQDPQLIFKLRGINVLEFISTSIHVERSNILKRSKNKNINALKDTNLSKLFGVKINK